MIRSSDILIRRAFFYSPLGFLRAHEVTLGSRQLAELTAAAASGKTRFVGADARFLLTHLPWDSDFFQCPVYRLDFAEWQPEDPAPVESLRAALEQIAAELSATHPRYYLFAEVPSEDLEVMQALGLVGYRLVETRITYFYENLNRFRWNERFAVRPAVATDVPVLREVAKEARNTFDRHHADPFFPLSMADDYLAKFVENSVRGFADLVLIPADDAAPPAAFMTAKLTSAAESPVGLGMGRVVLAAVGSARRGWHLRLMSEMTYHFQQAGLQFSYMKTQATNRPVIRNCEKLGYQYGRSTHVFAR
jgi:dTDP-4-amino-4,6-dideoxy-D-galactose acyltransferase